MNHIDREVIGRLGNPGLRQVLGDLLDQARLVKLANACGLRYPGMRTQSQKRERILDDLVDRAQREDAARRAIYRTLAKETSSAVRAWTLLKPEERARRLQDEPLSSTEGRLGLHLFVSAATSDEESLPALLARCDKPTPPAPSPAEEAGGALSREAARLKKKNAELQKKTQYLEGQIAKIRDAEKTLKRELMQRKGELAESRMRVERLRREVQGSHAVSSEPAPAAPATSRAPDAAVEGLATATRKLLQEQRKLAHALEKLAAAPVAPATVSPEILAPILQGIEELKKETATLRRERKRDDQQHDRVLAELRAELDAVRAAAEEAAPTLSRPARRRKGETDRVGVFIDVQNVYYAARQLKGKLDFDALLQAVVRGRRLIQAKAYVVESQEIDQSGFIAMLQQRAIEVRRKTLKVRSDGSMKGDWDMEMALDILDAAPKLDVVVLVSGDGDFTSLVNRVKAMGPRVEVAAFPRNTAKSLLEAADEFQALDRKFMIRLAGRAIPEGPPSPAHAAAASGGGESAPSEDGVAAEVHPK